MLTRRAIEDPDFRERLIQDPRSTIAEATGQDVPEDVEIVVVENGPKNIHIVLPSEDLDLSAMDVSGGVLCGVHCGRDFFTGETERRRIMCSET